MKLMDIYDSLNESKSIQRYEDIHDKCLEYGQSEHGVVDYVKGANIAGFVKVADAIIAQGVI